MIGKESPSNVDTPKRKRHKSGKKQTDLEKINQMLEKILQNDKRETTAKNTSEKLVKELENLSMDSLTCPCEDLDKVYCFELFKNFTKTSIQKCQIIDMSRLALSLQYFQFDLIKKFFHREDRLSELIQLGEQLKDSAAALCKLKNEEKFKKIQNLMETIFSEMQAMEDVEIISKCDYVASFMIHHGNCLCTLKHYQQAIENGRMIEFLINTVFPQDAVPHKTLAYCQITTIECHIAIKSFAKARMWFEKTKLTANKITELDWKDDEKATLYEKLQTLENQLSIR